MNKIEFLISLKKAKSSSRLHSIFIHMYYRIFCCHKSSSSVLKFMCLVSGWKNIMKIQFFRHVISL